MSFKFVYRILIILTIVATAILVLTGFGTISIISETGKIAIAAAIQILLLSFFFGRTSNVIMNKNFRTLGYIGTFVGLFTLIMVAFQLTGIEALGKIYKSVMPILYTILGIITVYCFIFEVPANNKLHQSFQRISALILTITLIGLAITANSFKSSLSSISSQVLTSSQYTDLTEQDKPKEKEVSPILIKCEFALIFISIACLTINPMLRTYYIDLDYFNEDSVEDLLSTPENTLLKENNPIMIQPKRDEKIDKNNPLNMNQLQQTQTPAIVPVPVPVPAPVEHEVRQPVRELVTATPGIEEVPIEKEKVINQQFHEEDFTEAEIPMINIVDNDEETTTEETTTEEATVPTTEQVETPTIEQVPTPTEAVQTPTLEQAPAQQPAKTTEAVTAETDPLSQQLNSVPIKENK